MPGKILILTPDLSQPGGISNYYNALSSEVPNNIEYFTRGSRNQGRKKRTIFEAFRIFGDFLLFLFKIIGKSFEIVQITTSLDCKSVYRDGIFLLLARITQKRIIVFFRGWSEEREKSIEQKCFNFFLYSFKKANAIIVLSNDVERSLRNWGFEMPIFKETTLVEKNIISSTNPYSIQEKFLTSSLNCLFLGRIEKYKGIEEAIEAVSLLQKEGVNIFLNIAGDGTYLNHSKEKAKNDGLRNYSFHGHLSGNEKVELFRKSHI